MIGSADQGLNPSGSGMGAETGSEDGFLNLLAIRIIILIFNILLFFMALVTLVMQVRFYRENDSQRILDLLHLE